MREWMVFASVSFVGGSWSLELFWYLVALTIAILLVLIWMYRNLGRRIDDRINRAKPMSKEARLQNSLGKNARNR